MNETSLSDELSIRTLTLTVRQQAYLIGHLSERVTALEKATQPPPTVGNAYTSPEGWEAKQKAVEANQPGALSGKIDAVVREIDNLDVRITALEGAKFLITTSSGYDELGEAHKYLDTLGVPRSEHPNARLCLQGRIDWLRHAPQISEDAKIGKAWREDSSLEKWFPFTAEELKKANKELKKLKELNDDKFKTINAYCKAASLDKWKIKTLIQAIERYLSRTECSMETSILTEARDEFLKATLTEYPPSAEQPKWRDAKSDPPTKPGHYIVHFAVAGRVTPLEFNGVYWLYSGTKTPLGNPNTVTHWQELPPPPQATEKV